MRRAAAGHRGRVLRRPPSPPCCNARCAPPRLATSSVAPSCATCPGGCGATAWRPSTFAPPGARRCRSRRRTTARNTPVGRSGGRDSTPPWWCWASTTGARPKLASDARPRGRHAQLAGRSAGRSSAPRASPWIMQDPPLRPPIATLRGYSRAAQQSVGVRSAGPRDRQKARMVVSLDGGRVRVPAQDPSVAPRRRRPRNRFHSFDWKEPKLLILYVVGRRRRDRLRRGPRSSHGTLQ